MSHMPTNGSGPEGVNTITVQDEGVEVGDVHTLNFVGANVEVVSFVEGVAIVTITGGGGGGGGEDPGVGGQVFAYTVTGSEPDLSEITVTLPEAEESTGYLALCTQQTATNHLGMSISSKGLTTFVLSLSGNATAGDIFAFHVFQP